MSKTAATQSFGSLFDSDLLLGSAETDAYAADTTFTGSFPLNQAALALVALAALSSSPVAGAAKLSINDPSDYVIRGSEPTAVAGTPQLPKLLNGYVARPPWEVAGVDYAVGVRSNITLKNPATISMAGVTVDTDKRTVYVTGNNVTLNGYDFSLNGGWGIAITDEATNTVIENSIFLVGASGKTPIYSDATAVNLTVMYCTFNGGGAKAADPALIYFRGSGTFVSEYNLFEDTPADAIDLNSASTLTPKVSFNLFYDLGLAPGAHADTVQFVGNAVNNYVFSYNTVYQPPTSVDGMEGVQVEAQGTVGATVDNSAITNNTLIAPAGAARGNTMSYVFALLGGANAPYYDTINNTLLDDNYVDPTGAFGTFYPLTYPQGGPTNTIISNNVDMTTGKFIRANNSEVLPTMVARVFTSPSSGVETAGKTITLIVELSAAVTVSGTPTLSLNDGGTAAYTGGSGSKILTFSYTVAATDSPESALAITQVNLPNGATIDDANGNTPSFFGLQIDQAPSDTHGH